MVSARPTGLVLAKQVLPVPIGRVLVLPGTIEGNCGELESTFEAD
jgi:hypothetical protein